MVIVGAVTLTYAVTGCAEESHVTVAVNWMPVIEVGDTENVIALPLTVLVNPRLGLLTLQLPVARSTLAPTSRLEKPATTVPLLPAGIEMLPGFKISDGHTGGEAVVLL